MQLSDWSCAQLAADQILEPSKLDSLDLDWISFIAPGTVAGAVARAGRWTGAEDRDFDESDWWFRCSFTIPDRDADQRWELCLEGVATLAEVWLNGEPVLSSTNMFRAHRIEVSEQLRADNELAIRCAALGPAVRAKRPRPRWKTNLVDHQNLRWFRTSLHGRRPTWTGAMAPVGPWRPVTIGPIPPVRMADVSIETRPDGHVAIAAELSAVGPVDAVVLVVENTRIDLVQEDGDGVAPRYSGAGMVGGVETWWPAGHGGQPLYAAVLEVTSGAQVHLVSLGRLGFCRVELGPDDAPVLRVNDEEIFVRGVSWVPVDPIGLAPSDAVLRTSLEQLRDAGMNMVRVPATAVYESDEFLALCDELGLMVWHDLMLARMDYPTGDPGFSAELRSEVAQVAARLAGHPSVAVVCGGSEVGQQAAMVGQPVPVEELVGSHVADVVSDRLPGVPYVIDVPFGGTHPFTVDVGLSNYFGVGGYRRPVADARLSGVRFATECLAFSHLPGDEAADELAAGGVAVGDPAWKRGVTRDPRTTWDFEDVRDHYVRELYRIDPAEVRAVDPDRYLDMGRAATAAVTAEVMGSWRRPDSGCGGALILEARDCRPGAGPGLVDVGGRPKAVLHAARRVLSPVALVPSDEGLNGLDVWAYNDGPTTVQGVLSVVLFSSDQAPAAQVEVDLALGPRSSRRLRVEELLGGFFDVTHAYRFGPSGPACVAMHWRGADALLARAVFRPGPPPNDRVDVGLSGSVVRVDDDHWQVEVRSKSYAHFVQIGARGAQFSDNGFDIEPGGSILVEATSSASLRARLRALNATDSTTIYMEHG